MREEAQLCFVEWSTLPDQFSHSCELPSPRPTGSAGSWALLPSEEMKESVGGTIG